MSRAGPYSRLTANMTEAVPATIDTPVTTAADNLAKSSRVDHSAKTENANVGTVF